MSLITVIELCCTNEQCWRRWLTCHTYAANSGSACPNHRRGRKSGFIFADILTAPHPFTERIWGRFPGYETESLRVYTSATAVEGQVRENARLTTSHTAIGFGQPLPHRVPIQQNRWDWGTWPIYWGVSLDLWFLSCWIGFRTRIQIKTLWRSRNLLQSLSLVVPMVFAGNGSHFMVMIIPRHLSRFRSLATGNVAEKTRSCKY